LPFEQREREKERKNERKRKKKIESERRSPRRKEFESGEMDSQGRREQSGRSLD